jgi:predicted site-specific integrase-resolvase
MAVIIGGKTFYRTAEVCDKVGISRSTLLRWLGEGVVDDSPCRDRRGWRLFTEADIKMIAREANRFDSQIDQGPV